MKRIEKTCSRHVNFRKRRSELLKRARELSSVCDAQVALILFSASGTLSQYASSRNMQEIIQAYVNTHKGKPFEPLTCSLSHGYRDEVVRLKEELQRLEREERRKTGDMKELELLSLMELDELEGEMISAWNSVCQMKDHLIAEKMELFTRKEQEILKENESLKNELKRASYGANEEESSTCNSCID